MKPRTLTFLLCCASLSLAAQLETSYNPKADYHTWSVKGKVLPYPILGNGAGISVLLGVEYGFAMNQSIGVDVFSDWSENSNDNVADTAGVQHAFGDYYAGFEKALFLNYRYYFNFRRLREKKGVAPYLLVFFRDGKIYQHFDPLYPVQSWISNRERQYSAGLMVGATMQSNLGPDRLDLDINLGIFDKLKEISQVYLENGVQTTVNSRPVGPGFRLSVNLVYWWAIKSGRG